MVGVGSFGLDERFAVVGLGSSKGAHFDCLAGRQLEIMGGRGRDVPLPEVMGECRGITGAAHLEHGGDLTMEFGPLPIGQRLVRDIAELLVTEPIQVAVACDHSGGNQRFDGIQQLWPDQIAHRLQQVDIYSRSGDGK